MASFSPNSQVGLTESHPTGKAMELFCSGWFKQASQQVAVAVHGPAHHRVVSDHFVKENVLFERTKHDEEAPSRGGASD